MANDPWHRNTCPASEPRSDDSMKTTRQSTFGATLRTTILLASLSGLLVVIGALIGGPSTAGAFLRLAPLLNPGSHFFIGKLALGLRRAQPIEGCRAPRVCPNA